MDCTTAFGRNRRARRVRRRIWRTPRKRARNWRRAGAPGSFSQLSGGDNL